MTAVVIDASAGVEIVGDTTRGRALIDLLPAGTEGWVPEALLRRGHRRSPSTPPGREGHQRGPGQGRSGQAAALAPASSLVTAAGARSLELYRHNIAAADAAYIALADHLGAALLTDDHKLVGAPTFPRHVIILTLPKSTAT